MNTRKSIIDTNVVSNVPSQLSRIMIIRWITSANLL